MLCQVSGNLGANDIDSTGDLEIIEPTPDGIGNAAGTVLLRRVWKAGEVAEPPHALSTTLYDTSGRTVCQGAGQLKLPAMPGLYILQWQTGECVSSQRITIIP